jgi:quinol monooxygenase YgiN
MFGIFATIKIKPDQHEQFLITIRETARRSVESEPGCLRFDVFQDLADQNRYILYEVYMNEDAFQKHLVTPHARHAMEKSRNCATGGFEVTRATSVYPDAEGYFITPKSEQ